MMKSTIPSDYSFLEKAFVYAGIVGGAVAPMALARYYLFNEVGPKEAWIMSSIVNLLPVAVYPHIPLPILTADVGRYIATKVVGGYRKLIEKDGLEKRL